MDNGDVLGGEVNSLFVIGYGFIFWILVDCWLFIVY